MLMFILGLIVGANVGIIFAGLCVAARRAEDADLLELAPLEENR
jgi:hypothetical protein